MRKDQPIRTVLYERGIGITAFADETGIRPSSHVRSAISGKAFPSPELRKRAVEILQLPLERLFTPDALSGVWAGPRGPKAQRPREPQPVQT